MKTNTAFIIQARLGSTRLPNKIMLPFSNGSTLIELLIKKLNHFFNVETIIATSINDIDIPLIKFCKENDVKYHAGSENDVLYRFINAASTFGISKIIRICSDNLFLDVDSISQLLTESQNTDVDYICFNVNGTPSIKTHFGFWAEYVTIDALKRVNELTKDPIYHEHVTNYIYEHPDKFKISWIDVDKKVSERKDIRLTIDTLNDFETAKFIYDKIGDSATITTIIDFLDNNTDLLQTMKEQINQNNK